MPQKGIKFAGFNLDHKFSWQDARSSVSITANNIDNMSICFAGYNAIDTLSLTYWTLIPQLDDRTNFFLVPKIVNLIPETLYGSVCLI